MQTVAVFNSAREVIRAERICRDNGLTVKVMPLPENLSSECGMCLHINQSDAQKMTQLMDQANINVTIHNNG